MYSLQNSERKIESFIIKIWCILKQFTAVVFHIYCYAILECRYALNVNKTFIQIRAYICKNISKLSNFLVGGTIIEFFIPSSVHKLCLQIFNLETH